MRLVELCNAGIWNHQSPTLASKHMEMATTTAERAGAAVGSGNSATMVTGVLSLVGFFLGLIFLVAALFLMRQTRLHR